MSVTHFASSTELLQVCIRASILGVTCLYPRTSHIPGVLIPGKQNPSTAHCRTPQQALHVSSILLCQPQLQELMGT